MDAAARISSKGQVTIPKRVRDALDLHEGDNVVFRIYPGGAVLARTVDLLDLAGTVPVPATRQGATWDDVRQHTRRARARNG